MKVSNDARTWKWDGQTVASILEHRQMLNAWPKKIQEWKNTVPADCREPVVMLDKNSGDSIEKWELTRIIAVDGQGQALLRLANATAPTFVAYSVMSIDDARAFIMRCRNLFQATARVACRM